MGAKRKRSGSPSGAGGATVSATASGGLCSRRVWLQLLAIVGLSGALGFTFNAASPLGVKFGEAPAAPAPTKVVTETQSIPVPPLRTNPVATPPLSSTPVQVATVASQPKPALPPPAPKSATAATPWSVSVLPANTNPVAPAVSQPTALTNPAPIHWLEAKAMVSESRAVLVDVRHKAMFDAGHIPGATSLPEMSPPEEFKAFLSQQATNITVIVYCSSTTCSQSARVANRLVNEFHWPAVRYMTGGYQEYQQLELAKPALPSSP